MGKIYKNQTALRIRLQTRTNLTGATAKVKYEKPSGATGDWDAVISNAEDGVVDYDIAGANDLDESGEWTFWAYVTFSGGTVAPGEPVIVRVYEEGD